MVPPASSTFWFVNHEFSVDPAKALSVNERLRDRDLANALELGQAAMIGEKAVARTLRACPSHLPSPKTSDTALPKTNREAQSSKILF